MPAFSLDTFEQPSFETPRLDLGAKLTAFNEAFKTGIKPENGYFQKVNTNVDNNLAHWLGVASPEQVAVVRPSCFSAVKNMLQGVESNGSKTLGLLKINKMKINPEFVEQNIKQHSGFSAEVISTAKENIRAQLNGSDLTTVRADDLPELFPKNDQYVDKVRINAKGDIVERIQTKFVGKTAEENLSKLASSKFDKFFSGGKVDKLEIPSNLFDEIKNDLIPAKLNKLESQLRRVTADGKTDVAQKLERRIERFKTIDKMLERSTVSSDEARYATLHPKRYAAKLFAKEVLPGSHEIGVKSSLIAAGLTAAISTVENIRGVMNGEINPQEAFADVAKDVGTAGAIGYGSAFISSTVARGMATSSHTLLRTLGKANVPAAIISFGIDACDSVTDYAHGEISGKELAYDLGKSATGVAGGMTGGMTGALAGAALGSVVPGAGTVAGFALGLAGGMLGYVAATGAYATAIEFATGGVEVLADQAEVVANGVVDAYSTVSAAAADGAEAIGNVVKDIASGAADTYGVVSTAVVENVDALKNKALEMGQSVIDMVASAAPEAVEDIRAAMNDFAASVGALIHL
jgi:hypothetical protein